MRIVFLFLAMIQIVVPDALPQATLLFDTRTSSVNAPVSVVGYGAVDSRFSAQLYAGPPGGPLVPVGEPVPFGDGIHRGFVNPTIVEIPALPANSPAEVKMVAWYRPFGATYEEAKRLSMARSLGGVSETRSIRLPKTGGGIEPPVHLVGLQALALIAERGGSYQPILGLRPEPQGLSRDPVPAGFSDDLVMLLENGLGIAFQPPFAFLATDYGGLQIYDFRDPSQPQRVAFLAVPGYPARDVGLHESIAVVITGVMGSNSGTESLQTIDISDPIHPRLLRQTSLAGRPQALTVSGDRALVAADSAGLYLNRISSDDSAGSVIHYSRAAGALNTVLVENLAYVARGTNGLEIVDLENFDSPQLMGSYTHDGRIEFIVVNGSDAYLLANRSVGLSVLSELIHLDVSDPRHPRKLSTVALPFQTSELALGARNLYLAEWTYPANVTQPNLRPAVSVLNIDPDAGPMRIIGRTILHGWPLRLRIHGDHLWVAADSGPGTYQIGPELQAQPDGRLALFGTRGQRYAIEEQGAFSSATHLPASSWNPITNLTLSASPQLVPLPTSDRPASFLRARRVDSGTRHRP